MILIDHANLVGLDLNLLVALDALLAEQSVTRAAARLGVRQPAMSHALARLRAQFGDDLLTRTPDGMRRTPRAEALMAPLHDALGRVQAITRPATPFDPATARQTFHIGLPDSVEVLLVPALLATLAAEAPGVRLRLHAVTDPQTTLDALDAGALDLGIAAGPVPAGRDHHKSRHLLTGHYCCLFNAPLVGLAPPITLEDYVRLPHVLTSLRRGERGVVDEALERLGLTRTVALTTPRFLAVPFIVQGAPVITTMHVELARRFAASLGLAISPPPVTLPDITLSLLWHASFDRDPAHVWLRRTLVRFAPREGEAD